jgi:hypothetical protein
MRWKRGTRRDALLGGFLIFVLPVLIVLAAAGFWWANLGFDNMLDMGEPRVSQPIDGM